MYYNIHHDKDTNKIHLWDDEKGYVNFQYENYCYVKTNEDTELKSIYGDNVKRKNIEEGEWLQNTFESDIQADMKVLRDLYYKTDDVANCNKIVIIDIENDSKDGFANISTANRKILSIACKDFQTKKRYVFILDEQNRFTLKSDGDTFYNIVETEKELLNNFIKFISSQKYTVITGWNSEFFDIPYIINRGKQIIPNQVKNLSPIGLLKDYSFQTQNPKYKIVGLNHLDYLALYKKYAQGNRSSYSLDFISDFELKKSKNKFEGSLNDLYEHSLDDFIKYNIQDVELIDELERKLNYLNIGIGIAHKGHVQYEDIFMQSKIIEGALLTNIKRNNLVAPNKIKSNEVKNKESIEIGIIQNWKYYKNNTIFVEKDDEENSYDIEINLPDTDILNLKNGEIDLHISVGDLTNKIELGIYELNTQGKIKQLPNVAIGAYVKKPLKGRYKWIIDLDFTSLYPSIIRSLNISPETIIGKKEIIPGVGFEQDTIIISNNNKEKKKITYEQLDKIVNNKQFAISCNNVIYNLQHRGLIPKVLDMWFEERQKFQKTANEHFKTGNEELGKEYDIKQYVLKILLNSVYGVLLMPSFRFYNKDNGEAVTLTGQEAIKTAEKHVNTFLGNRQKNNEDYVIALDTDSTIINVGNFVNDINDVKKLATELQKYVNDGMIPFTQDILHIDKEIPSYFSMKQEMIADCGFFVGRKMYGMHIVDKKGILLDELEIKGIAVVRSSYPKFFKHGLQSIFKAIMDFETEEQINKRIENLKIEFNNTNDITVIATPTGVKQINKYINVETRYISGTPINSKSAINHNLYLEVNKLTQHYQPIYENDKIKYVYLKENTYNFDTIAFKENSPKELMEFIKIHLSYDKIWESALTKKLKSYYKILGWKSLDEIKIKKTSVKERKQSTKNKQHQNQVEENQYW